MIITIDGPSGTGKSSVAKKVADSLGFLYFDTGAMYRAIAYGVLSKKINHFNEDELVLFLKNCDFQIRRDSKVHYFLNGEDITTNLRTLEVTEFSSKISTLVPVREKLTYLQRTLAKGQDSVFEGRDMGTVVFPQADLKIFLTADPLVRAKRRHNELIAQDPSHKSLSLDTVLSNIKERDARDESRALAPLKPAEDALIIDTSNLSLEEVIEEVKNLFINRKSK